MDVATALHASAAVLLVIAGFAKLARPATTADLIFALGVRRAGPFGLERLAAAIGLIELAAGGIALGFGGSAIAAFVGVLYVGFVVAVLRALAVGAGSCGCFGRVDAPPSWFHVGGNAVLAVASFVAVAAPTPVEVMEGQPAGGVGFVVLVGVLAGLSLVMFTALPEALAARRSKVDA